MGAGQSNQKEVDPRKFVSTSLARHTIRWSPAAVKHDLIPVLSCCNSEKQQKGVLEIVEVLEVIKHLTVCDGAEREDTHNGEHEENEH